MAFPPEHHYNDQVFSGDVQFTGTIGLPSGSLDSADIASGANLAEAKLQHRHVITYYLAGASTVAAGTFPLFLAYKGCTILGVELMPYTAPTGGDLAYTVDVKKSTAAGAYATILSSVYTVNSTKADRTAYAATLSGTPTMIATDALAVVVAVSGSTGTQGLGLTVCIYLKEDGA